MRMHARLIGLAATTLVGATTLADIPNDPTQVQPLAVGTRAPTFSAQTKDGAVRTFSLEGYQ
jgi:hypothetical protein